jgi:hypothetical protein
MYDPIQQFAGPNLENLHPCWGRLQAPVRDGLLSALKSEFQNATEELRAALRGAGPFGAEEWINTACQLVGSAGLCSAETFGPAATMTRVVLLMYASFVYLRESCIRDWRNALPRDGYAGTQEILTALNEKRFRTIRNSIAHARWKVVENGRSLLFVDERRDGSDHREELAPVSQVTT